MASNDRVTRVTIDCVETIIHSHPVVLFNSPSPVEGREMICVPMTRNGNYVFYMYLYSTVLYLPPRGFMCLLNWCLLIIAHVSTVSSRDAPRFAEAVSSILFFSSFFKFELLVSEW